MLVCLLDHGSHARPPARPATPPEPLLSAPCPPCPVHRHLDWSAASGERRVTGRRRQVIAHAPVEIDEQDLMQFPDRVNWYESK